MPGRSPRGFSAFWCSRILLGVQISSNCALPLTLTLDSIKLFLDFPFFFQ
jgi:hypothetical protein